MDTHNFFNSSSATGWPFKKKEKNSSKESLMSCYVISRLAQPYLMLASFVLCDDKSLTSLHVLKRQVQINGRTCFVMTPSVVHYLVLSLNKIHVHSSLISKTCINP